MLLHRLTYFQKKPWLISWDKPDRETSRVLIVNFDQHMTFLFVLAFVPASNPGTPSTHAPTPPPHMCMYVQFLCLQVAIKCFMTKVCLCCISSYNTCIFLHWSWKHSASLLVYIIADSFLHIVMSVFEGYSLWCGAAYCHRWPLADSESHKMVHLPPLWSFWFNVAHDNCVLWRIHQFGSLDLQPVVHDSVMLPVETFEMRKHLLTLSLAKPREKTKAILKTCIKPCITLLIHFVKM
jgi:hypothetical protein